MSLVLFIYGGILGALITGQNVVIPAHYHGSIVGVTLAFMGLAYLMLPQLGYKEVANWKLAYWQPIVYGVGQIMHISGLAYSGGYGVLRKTPAGEMADISFSVKAALGFMGLGGLIAIIGGLMFVVVVYMSCRTCCGISPYKQETPQ
jgi:heme/copper-type cytochrome/quinol oxidase subunit 1